MNKGMKSLLVLVVLLLSGCVGAVLLGAAAGGAVVNDSRNLITMEEDTRISHELGLVFTRNKTLKKSHIVVSTFDHMVFLGGEVPNEHLKKLAEKIALANPKVKRVYNEITIGPNNTLKQQAIDAWVTAEVKTKMLTRKGLRSGSIKVITENGVVFLMGYVSHAQANLAVDVTRRVKNVRRVIKIFHYTD